MAAADASCAAAYTAIASISRPASATTHLACTCAATAFRSTATSSGSTCSSALRARRRAVLRRRLALADDVAFEHVHLDGRCQLVLKAARLDVGVEHVARVIDDAAEAQRNLAFDRV